LKPNATFIDVGANIGWYTVLASVCVGAGGKVFAFEPVRRIFQHLTENVQINHGRNVFLERLAISDKCGTAILSNVDPRNDGSGSIVAGRVQGEEVTTEELDTYCAARGISNIDLLKLDVEGAEMLALGGMKSLLSERRVKRILFEYDRSLQEQAGQQPHAVLEFLERFGFEFGSINYFGFTERLHDISKLRTMNIVARCR
jgi:FkbM family methyltransferase